MWCGGYIIIQGASNDAELCRSMKCYHPDFQYCYTTYEQRAFTGTSCANRKVSADQLLCYLYYSIIYMWVNGLCSMLKAMFT